MKVRFVSKLRKIFLRSMTTLGDSLLAKGQLYAAQFCYIVSGAEWGTFAKKGSKLVLLCAQVLTFVLPPRHHAIHNVSLRLGT